MTTRSQRGVLLASAFALFLSGCATNPAPTAPSSTGGQAQPAGPKLIEKLTYGTGTITPSMDPIVSIAGSLRKYDLYETLTTYDAKGVIQPMLATKWESSSPTAWTFTLRQDAKFHDGTQVKAKDVEFSWTRATAPGARSHVPGNMSTVDKITANGDFTVNITTKAPDPLLPRRFFYLSILPQAALEKSGDQAFFQNPIGSGPFKFKEFVPDSHLALTRWAEHPYRKANINELTIRAVPDNNARVNGLRTGELDISAQIPLDAAETFSKENYSNFPNNISHLTLVYETLGSDGVDPGPIGNRLVRLAMNYAIDRDAISKGIYRGFAKTTSGTLSEGVNGRVENLVPYAYDPAKSRQLLAQAGYPNGFKVKLEFQTSVSETQSTMLAVQDQLKAIGIEVELAPVDSPTWVDKIYKRKPPAPLLASTSSPAPMYDGDANFIFFWSQSPFGKRFSDAEYDTKFLASRQEMDPAKRLALLQDLEKMLVENPAQMPLVTSPSITVWKPTVKNVNVPGDNTPFFDLISG